MKTVNVVLGIATAFILAALITLGIKAFYPEPQYPAYTNPVVPVAPCASGDTACLNTQSVLAQQQADIVQQQEQTYEDAMQAYNRNLFIIANIIGIIMFAIGFWLIFGTALSSQGVPVGIMLAGLWSIIYGYGRGWDSTNDQLKFFIGLVIAVIVIGGSMWLMQRHQNKHSHTHHS